MYEVILARQAQRALRRLPQRDAQRIIQALVRLRENPRMPDVIKLEGAAIGTYRYRIGNYRILFDINDQVRTVEVLDIRRRSQRTYRA